MKALLTLSITMALASGNAAAQAHVHAEDTAHGHDHAAASGSGQAAFDAAMAPGPHAAHRTTAPAATNPASGPHAGHGSPGVHEGHETRDGHGDKAAESAAPDPHAAHGRPSVAPPSPAPYAPRPHVHGTHAPDAHAQHGSHAPATAAPREPIPAPTEADRAAAFPHLHGDHHAHGTSLNSLVRFNRFEAWDADPGNGQAWEGSAWFGGDVQRLWLRSEGEREHGHTAAADLEVLYGRGVGAWWDLVAGVRQEFEPGPSRTMAAFGVQGMAPYKFEVSATAYVGEGQASVSAEAEYELLLTNRLVLQPVLEVQLNGRQDARRGEGKGLASAEAGLRLRYEVRRRFAPYIGVVHERSFGDTADMARAGGEASRETRWVAGVRWWF